MLIIVDKYKKLWYDINIGAEGGDVLRISKMQRMREDLEHIENVLCEIEKIDVYDYISEDSVDNLMYRLETLKDSIYIQLKAEETFLLEKAKKK